MNISQLPEIARVRIALAQLRAKTFSTHRVANATAVESLNFPLASVVPFPACASVTGGPPRPGADSPFPRPVQCPDLGPVIELPEVGGLRHRYVRQAA